MKKIRIFLDDVKKGAFGVFREAFVHYPIQLIEETSAYFGKCLTKIQCCGSGSGIRCLFDPWIRDPGSGMGFFRIPDPGSRIPRPYFEELFDNFFGKKFYNSLKIGPIFFLWHFKTKIIYNFVKFCGYLKRFDI
jgi:hypothetical protein